MKNDLIRVLVHVEREVKRGRVSKTTSHDINGLTEDERNRVITRILAGDAPKEDFRIVGADSERALRKRDAASASRAGETSKLYEFPDATEAYIAQVSAQGTIDTFIPVFQDALSVAPSGYGRKPPKGSCEASTKYASRDSGL
jgi:hypothetical protein